MKIKAVLFDLDNTLYDYDSADRHARKALFKASEKYLNLTEKEFDYWYKLSKEEIKRELAGTASSHSRILYIQRLIEKKNKTVEPSQILELYNAYWDTLISHAKPLDGAIKLLKYLKKTDRKVLIVSNLTAQVQIRKIAKLKLDPYIDFLVTSEEAGVEKPHPSIFLLALNKIKVLPNEALFVGDDPKSDIEGGNSIGMDTIHLEFGKNAKLDHLKGSQIPNYKVKALEDIIPIIESKERNSTLD